MECKKEVCEKIKMESALCELSMGMSSDFEKAVSTHVIHSVLFTMYIIDRDGQYYCQSRQQHLWCSTVQEVTTVNSAIFVKLSQVIQYK